MKSLDMFKWNICCFILLSFCCPSNCHWYLLLNAAETKKLLGVPGELFYVKEGVVNEYALAFNMNIQPDIEEMHFEWYNDVTNPSTPQIAYSAKVHLSNNQAILQPYLNIASQGLVPTKRSPFTLLLRCAGDFTAEVEVKLRFEFRIGSQFNSTGIEIKRRKICVRDADIPKFRGGLFKSTESNFVISYEELFKSVYGEGDFKEPAPRLTEKYHYVIIGCGIGVFLVVFLIAVFCCCRNRKRRNNHSNNNGVNNASCPSRMNLPVPLKTQDSQNYCTYTSTNDSVSSGSSGHQHTLPFPYHRPTYQEAVYLLNEMKFNRNLISLGEVMMQGLHGSIYRGFANILSSNGELVTRQQVIIKAFLDEAKFDPISSNLLTDACLLRGLSHANLSPCIGSCLDHFPMMVLYEDAGFENLKMFLTRMKNVEVLSPQQLTYMSLQIARGLAFLHSKKILHKDVATRNCLVTHNLQTRLGDGFLSSDIFPDDYHPTQDGECLPIRWMAIESIADSNYSPASDIWSLGVLVWELFSGAELPFENIGSSELAHHLIKGFRLQQPRTCPNELFAMTAQCWLVSPGERPRMNHLLTFLVNFYNTLSRFV